MHSLGDVWHPGPGVPCFGGFGGFCSLWGLTVSLSSLFPILPYLNAFLRWRLASWPWGSLFRRFWRVLQPLGAHSLTFFPILPYLNAFLRWRLASWPWGSLFRRFWRVLQPLGLTVSLSSLFFPILMHSLGDVWHPGPGVPCFGGFGLEGFAAFGGSQSHFLPYSLFFPILMHSLGDVWHPGPGVPCFGGFGGFCSLWRLAELQRGTPTAVPRFLALGVGGRGSSP